jgi:hypothetical protein
MRVIPLLLGCLLGLGAIATAAANGSSTAGALGSSSSSSYNCTNQPSEHSNHDAVPTSGGVDAVAASHDGTVSSSPSTHSNNTNSASESDATHFGDDALPNHSSHSSGLSWQSLLPGSIQ